MRFSFDAEVWQWDARTDSAWFFVSLPVEASEDIRELPRIPRGFGAVKVRARIGEAQWSTSIFPDATVGTYVLPLKRSVRKAQDLHLGSVARVDLEVIEG